MRIGMIAGEYPPMQGGVGAYTQILSRELARQGHDLFVLASPGTVEPDASVTLSHVKSWRGMVWRQVDAWARAIRLDIVNLQYQTAAFGMSPMIHFIPERVRSAPVITTAHDLRFPYLFPKAGPLRPWIVRRMLSRSAGVIATNHEDFAQIQHAHKALIPIGSNIPDSSGPVDVAATRQAFGIPRDTFLLCFFGLLNASKGLHTLIDGFWFFRDSSHPVDCTLVIVGDVGSSDPTNAATARAVREQITMRGLSDAVHFTGFLEEARVMDVLRASDVIVLPFSDGASFRRGSLMAAIRSGRPIVTTKPRVPIPEFDQHPPLYLFRAGDGEMLELTIRQVHNHMRAPDFPARLAAGTAALNAHFQWEGIARRTAEFFSQVIA